MLKKFNLQGFVTEKLCSCARSQEVLVIPAHFLWQFSLNGFEWLWNEALQTLEVKVLGVAQQH